MDHRFEHMMTEAFPSAMTERIVRRHIAAAAVFAFYMIYTPGIHADQRKEKFTIEGVLPGTRQKLHRYSCEE